MRKRPSIAPHVKPYRIAVLLPQIDIEGPDTAFEREVALVLRAVCLEECRRHPQLAVLDRPMSLVRSDGHFVFDHEAGGRDFECVPLPQSRTSRLFSEARRDALIWLDLALGPESGVVRLHCATRYGDQRSIEASGRTLGEQIREALDAWLRSRGLESSGAGREVDDPRAALEVVAATDVIAAGRVLAQALVGPTQSVVVDKAASPTSGFAARDGRSLSRSVIDRLAPPLQLPMLRVLEFALRDDRSGGGPSSETHFPISARLSARRSERAGVARPQWTGTSAIDRSEAVDSRSTRFGVETVAPVGIAAVLQPDSLDVLEAAAETLVRADRFDEALRLVERGVRLHGEESRAHLAVLRTLESSDRVGCRLARAMVALRNHGCPTVPDLPLYPDQIEVDLRASSALVSVGRLHEAIALRASRLRDREAAWPGQARLLDRWRTEPRFLAQSYAREGYFRGDTARVLEGFSRASPADSVDLSILIESLVAVGREHEAALAWGQFGLGHGYLAPTTRLAAVNALLAAGHYRLGLEELWRVELTAPANLDATAISRCGVVLAAVPLDVIETAVGERIASGAVALARRMARIVADYVPAAATSTVIERALTQRSAIDPTPHSRGGAVHAGAGAETLPRANTEAIEFDMAWLAGFSVAQEHHRSTSNVDQLFVELGPLRTGPPADAEVAAELARGDRLVTAWLPAVHRDAGSTEPQAIGRVAAYAAAQALSRYLAATTFPPSPIAGALRTVACEALMFVHAHRDWLADRDAHAVVMAVEPLLRRVDRWVGTAWLAMAERCLEIDERVAGDLSGFFANAPTVAARILGPEETALLSRSISRLHRERREGWATKVDAQASRLAMHTGNAGLDEWADAIMAMLAAQEVDLDDAIDSLHTACYLAEGVTAGPCVSAARTLFAAGRAHTAFDVLTSGFSMAVERGESWRAQQLGALRDAWTRSKLDVPFDLTEGTAPMFEELKNRDPVHSERLGRWAIAFDPSDAEAHRILGLALAAQQNAVSAMHYLVRGTRDRATEILAVALNEAGFLDEAKTVLSYAHRWGAQALPVQPDDREASLLEAGDYDAAAARLSDDSWRVRCAALQALRFRTNGENHVEVTARAQRGSQTILAQTVGAIDPSARACRALALQIREQAHFARDPVPALGDRMTPAAFEREFRIRCGESISEGPAAAEPADRVVLSNSNIARVSDYVALLADLAQLTPEDALAQFGLDAAGYREVARAWAEAMDADPTIRPMVEAGLARRCLV